MSGAEFQRLWRLLNEATGCAIDARRTADAEQERKWLRKALEETRRAEREILRQLGVGYEE